MTAELGILVALLVAASVWAVMAYSLVLAAIALGAASAVLAIIMFLMGFPTAAVLELSVCAGLITVVFISAISLTPKRSPASTRDDMRRRMKRFLPLPFILLAGAFVLWFGGWNFDAVPAVADAAGVRETLWGERSLDILGQIVIILTGAFAVVVLFKNLKRPGEDGR